MDPIVSPCRWILLGLAMANETFRERFFREVGPEAFPCGNLEREVYELVQWGPPWDRVMARLGVLVTDGQKPWDAMIAALNRAAVDHRWGKVALHIQAGRIEAAKDEARSLLS